jgi:NAD(P)H-flavin reductase
VGGKQVLHPNDTKLIRRHEKIGLIAGGTGITPCYQLIKHILNNPNDKTKITLVYGSVHLPLYLLFCDFGVADWGRFP